MKKGLLLGSLAAILLLSGCSKKSPEVVEEETMMMSDDGSEVIVDEVVIIDSDGAGASKQDNMIELVEEETIIIEDKGPDLESIQADMQSVYFAFDRYNLIPDMQDKVEENANVLNSSSASSYSVKVEGNCDEWGTDEYNYALGLKRAEAAKKELEKDGVDASRIFLISYGESNPVCMEKTKECWAKNRRADFKILP